MRGRLTAAALALASACSAPLRVADPALEVRKDPATARLSAGGVTVDLAAGDERGWLGALPPGLMPVVATIRNGAGSAIRVRSSDFVLVLPDGRRKAALDPGRVEMELRARAPAYVPGSSAPYLPVPGGPADRAALSLLYAWPGLHGVGSVALSDRLRPDPRPRPEGTLANGASGSVVLVFEAEARRLASFSLEASIEGEGGEALGTASAPFARAK